MINKMTEQDVIDIVIFAKVPYQTRLDRLAGIQAEYNKRKCNNENYGEKRFDKQRLNTKR